MESFEKPAFFLTSFLFSMSVPSLKLTANAPENRAGFPNRKFHLPTIHVYRGPKLLVSGALPRPQGLEGGTKVIQQKL